MSQLVQRRSCQVCPWGALTVFATVITLLSLNARQSATHFNESNESLLSQVCDQSRRHTDARILFKSPEEVRNLIREHEQQQQPRDGAGNRPVCDPVFDQSFGQLAALLEPDMLQDVCSSRMHDLVRDFHTKFIHFYLPETKRQVMVMEKVEFKPQPIPRALRDFFILFVKQIDATCKQHLLNALARMSWTVEKILKNEDYALVGHYRCTNNQPSSLYQLNRAGLNALTASKPHRFKDLQIVDLTGGGGVVDHCDANADKEATAEGRKLYVQVPFDDRLMRLKTACERRFRPVYMEIFAPVIRLNNLGYTQRSVMQMEDHELNHNFCVRRWFDIIQACEVLRDVEVLYEPGADAGQLESELEQVEIETHLEDPQQKIKLSRVKILSREEGCKLRERLQKSSRRPPKSIYDPRRIVQPHRKMPFGPTMMIVDREEAERELKAFESDIKRYVRLRTSKMVAWRNEVDKSLRNFFHTHRNQLLERDESSAMGRLAAFFDRHQFFIMSIPFAIGIILLFPVLTAIISG